MRKYQSGHRGGCRRGRSDPGRGVHLRQRHGGLFTGLQERVAVPGRRGERRRARLHEWLRCGAGVPEHQVGADHTGARPVVHDDSLAEGRSEVVRDPARADVGNAGGRGRRDEADGSRRIRLGGSWR